MSSATISRKLEIKNFIVYIMLIVAFCYLQFLSHKNSFNSTTEKNTNGEYVGNLMNPKIVKRLLGTNLLVSDLLWVDFLIKHDHEHEKENYTTMYKVAKVILELDPDNFYAYYVFGIFLSVIKDDIKGATAILSDGANYIKNYSQYNKSKSKYFNAYSSLIFFMLGYNLIFEEREFEQGAKWIREAATFEEAKPMVKNLAAKLANESGVYELASYLLNDFYKRLTDVEEKKKIEKKLIQIASLQELAHLNERFTKYLSATGSYGFNKKKALRMFLKSIQHGYKSIAGKILDLDEMGKIIEK